MCVVAKKSRVGRACGREHERRTRVRTPVSPQSGEKRREKERRRGRERKKKSAARHIATEDEKGDSRGRKTLGNSEEWDGGVGGMGDRWGREKHGAPLGSSMVGIVQGRGNGGARRVPALGAVRGGGRSRE